MSKRGLLFGEEGEREKLGNWEILELGNFFDELSAALSANFKKRGGIFLGCGLIDYIYPMQGSTLITIAGETDIPALVTLVNSAYRGDSSKKGWTTEADLLDGVRTDPSALAGMMEPAGNLILKCEDGAGNLQGCVYLAKKNDKLYLGMLTVSPELQALGLGRKMLAAAEDHARLTGCRAITMTVISVRHELIAWYERNGYHATGETEPFPTDPAFGLPRQPLHFIVMEKLLAQ
ncbi:MAG: family acetyltransferase [Sediminibacterium sp.]|nr:family acetyltransferase [Sediminibacterium sp.]